MKNKGIIITLVLLVLLSIAAYFINIKNKKAPIEEENLVLFDPLNATYKIEDEETKLINGKAEKEEAPGSAMKTVTNVFGSAIYGDLNNDGRSDAAIMIEENSGGSGTFFYVAVAINEKSGAKGTNAVFLGDRIAPQNIEIKNGNVIANYADRKPNEPMTARPSVGVSKYLVLEKYTLKEGPRFAGPGEHCGGKIPNNAVCISKYHCEPGVDVGDMEMSLGGICVLDKK